MRETMKRTVTNLDALALRQVSTAMLVQHGVANRSKRLRHWSQAPDRSFLFLELASLAG